MKAQDLRVGNWIKQPGRIGRVSEVWQEAARMEGHNNAYHYEQTTGIPITEEWLLNLGFKLFEQEGDLKKFRIFIKGRLLYNTNYGWYYKDRLMTLQPKYIHELQNLFFVHHHRI